MLTLSDAISADGVFPECRLAAPYERCHCEHRDEHDRSDDDQRNGPQPTLENRCLALVDVGVPAGGCRRLAQVGGEARPTFDLEPVLVEVVEKDGEIERQESDDDQDDASDADI